MRSSRAILLVLLVAGCGEPRGADAGDASSRFDAGPGRATRDGGGSSDGGRADAGDGRSVDAGRPDAGEPDAGPLVALPGQSCSAAVPCADGPTMECRGGPTCGDEWRCVEVAGCKESGTSWCGCDGVTFTEPTTCPRRPHAYAGECAPPGGLDCDPRGAEHCLIFPDPCASGWAFPVRGGCFETRCVPLSECACSEDAECPEGRCVMGRCAVD